MNTIAVKEKPYISRLSNKQEQLENIAGRLTGTAPNVAILWRMHVNCYNFFLTCIKLICIYPYTVLFQSESWTKTSLPFVHFSDLNGF